MIKVEAEIMKRLKISVQSMTNADSFLNKGPYEAFRHLSELGFSCIELSQHIQVNEETIPEIIKAQKDFHFEICAISTGYSGSLPSFIQPMTHNGITLTSYSMEKDFYKLLEYCRALNCKNIRFAGIPGRRFYNFNMMADYMKLADEMAARLGEYGIKFCAHNHCEEFVKLEGKTVFEWAIELAPNLCFELDVFGAQRSGVNPVEAIRLCGDRAVLLHLKDLRIKPADPKEGEGRLEQIFQGVEIGEGNMNMKSICEAAIECGSKYLIIEQSEFYGRDPYHSLTLSADNLRKMGYGDCF
jgi:sugar phosphate isomerase/epimerase